MEHITRTIATTLVRALYLDGAETVTRDDIIAGAFGTTTERKVNALKKELTESVGKPCLHVVSIETHTRKYRMALQDFLDNAELLPLETETETADTTEQQEG